MEDVGRSSPTPTAVDVVSHNDGTYRASLRGDIDMSSSDNIRAMLEAEIPPGGNLILDLSAVEFMDSSGIAMLITTSRRVSSLTIETASPAARLVIETTGLAEVLGMET